MIKTLLLFSASCLLALIFSLFYLYQVKEEGELRLKNVRGEAIIYTEKQTGLKHIKASDRESVAYAQGFLHAQTRLWQLEKTRRAAKGELAEVLGEKIMLWDKFMRALGMKKHCME